MARTILIIGGGIAGLSAGVYAQMNGYHVRIIEQHVLPGGLCTSWSRKGYTINGCIHWLVGSAPGINFHRVWNELGALEGKQIIDPEVFSRYYSEGQELIVYTDLDRFRTHLLELSPQDSPLIDQMLASARRLSTLEVPIDPPQLMGLRGGFEALLNILPLLGDFWRYRRLSLREFAQRFHDPFLREAFSGLFDLPDFPLVAFLMTLGWMHRRTAGYPIGGSLEFARSIEKRFRDLGGEILYGIRVEKILVERHRAVGVRLQNGTELRGDWVISAADGHSTLFDMLEGKYLTRQLRKVYEAAQTFPPIVHVSLGVKRDLSSEPSSYRIGVEPFGVGGSETTSLKVQHYAFDPTLAPPGKSVLTMILSTDYDSWKTLYADRERYRAEKESIATEVIRRLEVRYPGLSEQVEMVDVSTPMTFERYTSNWKASWEGWLITTKNMSKSLPKKLPRLAGFFMIGQWVQPGGGLPPVALHGRQVVRLICHKDKRIFAAQAPLPATSPLAHEPNKP